MDDIAPATLIGREGEEFTIGGVATTLAHIDRTESNGAGSLSARFVAGAPHGLEQGMAEVAHPDLAPTALLVVPSSPSDLVITFTWLAPPS